MSKFDDYVKEVLQWNKEIKFLLESEAIDRNEEVWRNLDRFAEMMEGISSSKEQDIAKLQNEVGKLHENMETYFTKRQQLGSIFVKEPSVPIGGHRLPPLPYGYNGLEPHISAEIMELHHKKHHQSYVDGLNKAEKMLEKARKDKDFSLVKHWSRELAFHGSGHYLHTIFWNNMSPQGGGRPQGSLLKEIESYFGSYEAFVNQFTEAAKQVEGVGWAILVWSPRSRHLEILQSERHMLLTQWDTIPLLVLDVWEHAYYLQYKNNRADYVKNWWNVVNWRNVEERWDQARKLRWKAY
ncbi:superoxide dismutase [Bacillus massilinigeriensis]|uniref:superoxide dismutase n=1 Tax=Bacillus massilionigeriensis TaxID=1805475 RepID=UPI00096B05B0|nr:superoxide dismutase [Bacillus massilionigeriensis]